MTSTTPFPVMLGMNMRRKRFCVTLCAGFDRDSISENRYYTFFSDGAVNDIGEIVDVAQRLKGYSISVKVEGEIDLVDPAVRDTAQEIEVSLGVKKN